MARPQQNANRRKRHRGEYDDYSSNANASASASASGSTSINLAAMVPDPSDEADLPDEDATKGGADPSVERNPRSQCLPVADLPADFDGLPLDGAQFLALANRANETLPSFTRVDNPYREYSPSIPVEEEDIRGIAVGDDRGEGSSSSGQFQRTKKVKQRHPALQKESWEVLFPIHYQSYRKNLAARWPPSPLLPYPATYPPLPESSGRSDWYMFINGYTVPSKRSKGKKKVVVQVDEEEAMNGGGGLDLVDVPVEVEEKVEKGESREPLVSVLQQLNASQTINVLSHFATWLDENINQLPSPYPSSPILLPTQPDEADDDDIPSATRTTKPTSTNTSTRAPDPLPLNYFNWIFALILVLPAQLSSGEISTLRELSRAAMRVAGWRWIRGVVCRDVGEGWKLGEKGWLKKRTQGGGGSSEDGVVIEDTVDEMLARCWIIVHAVAIGWGQKDLLEELESLFS
ncbi:hypothetical protein CI109_101179 [Kwoniella shandongensis]|uniref:Uncharacterized protein n=1 Tax=Kwoniella shandongensis TaxID=1734106 RepID=A0A5M6BU23_9TREE|nr:uncharacterized protein CI109_005502 [Kwoniella shandongensis]KAA5526223.1 hypothetical protein CI109_005502 [Kwoniella shandongensis]